MSERDWFILGAVAVAGLWFWSSDAFAALAEGVNPTGRNVAARGVDALGDVFNDGERDDDFRLGVWLFNQTHGTDHRVVDGNVVFDDGG